jgi:thiamine-phosphate pyrophosphorylase
MAGISDPRPAVRPNVRRGLYAVTQDEADTSKLLAAVEAALNGGAVMVQYRNKSADAATRRLQAAALLPRCRARGVPLIVNDDAALARDIGADGAHLGAEDGDIAAARQLLGPARWLGVSCYNRIEFAENALAAGADYVAFGSFFLSATKPGAVRAATTLVSDAKRRHNQVPVAAIGGITRENAPALIAAGADWLCVISALFQAPDIESAARSFSALFPAHHDVGPDKIYP